MKKFFYLFLVLLSFSFVPKVFALEDYYIFNEDISSPAISETDDNTQGLLRLFNQTVFKDNIEQYNAYYCGSFAMRLAGNYYTICATSPFVFDSYGKYIRLPKQSYVLLFNSLTTYSSLKQHGLATQNSNGYFTYQFDSSNNNSLNWNVKPILNFHLSSSFSVGGTAFDESKFRFVSMYKKYDSFTGELSSFTYMNDKQQNKYSKFMTIFENPTNATYNFGYERGFMYYNNTVFRFDDTFTVRQGFPTSIQTQNVFPLIYQFNEDLSFPEYDGTTVDYTRLYFTNDNLGQTNGIYTFYRDVTDWAWTNYEQVQGVWTGTSEYDIVNFDINVAPVIPGEEEEEGTTNEDINNSINDINNNIMDDTPPDTSGLSDTAGWLPAGPVDSILNLPLTLLQRLNNSVNGTCSPLRLPLPFVNQTMELPCLNTVYSRINGLNTFMTFFSTVISTLILYYYFKNLYEWVGKKVSLNNDESWGGI